MPYNDEVEYQGNIIGGATLWLNNGLDEGSNRDRCPYVPELVQQPGERR